MRPSAIRISGGGANPAGKDGSVQYKKGEQLAGDYNLYYDEDTGTLTIKSKTSDAPSIFTGETDFTVAGGSFIFLTGGGDEISQDTYYQKVRSLKIVYKNGLLSLDSESVQKYFPEAIKKVYREGRLYTTVDALALLGGIVNATNAVANLHDPVGQISDFIDPNPTIVSQNVTAGWSDGVSINSIDLSGATFDNTEFGVLRGIMNVHANISQYDEPLYGVNISLDKKTSRYESWSMAYGSVYQSTRPYYVDLHQENDSGMSARIYFDIPELTQDHPSYDSTVHFVVAYCVPTPILQPITGVGEIVWQDYPMEYANGYDTLFTFHDVWRPYKIIIMKNGVELKNGEDVDIESLNFARKVIFKEPPALGDVIWARYEIYPRVAEYYRSDIITNEPIFDLSSELPPYDFE